MPSTVRKRDGHVVAFDRFKIWSAVSGAWSEVHPDAQPDDPRIQAVVDAVVDEVLGEPEVTVEDLQDLVERTLMALGFADVARAYIVYRQRHADARDREPDPRAISDYIHASKYARHDEALGRRELYAETVQRVEAMHLRRFAHVPGMEELIRGAFDIVREQRVLPSMRSMQFGGAAIEAINPRIYNCSSTLVDRPRVFSEALYLLLCGCGVGYSVQFEHVEQLPEFARVDQKLVAHHVVADTIEGWSEALWALARSFMVPESDEYGRYVEFSYHLVRDAGAPLKTSGGRAPGHLQLKESLERIRAILLGAQGRQLRPIECHRVMCWLASAVLSGGIRRSAMICLFSPDDGELMSCKADEGWYQREPYLAYANNSAVLVRGEATERQFRRVISQTRRYGDPGAIFVNHAHHVFNPCQPGWASVLTPEGIRQFDDIGIGSTIWSGKRWTKVTNKVMTGIKQVNVYHTRAGSFVGTSNHRVLSGGERVEVKDAETIDIATGGAEGGALDPHAVMDGLVIGDGMVHKASNHAVWLCIGENDTDYHSSEIGGLIVRQREAASAFAWEIKTSISPEELPYTYEREVPARYRFGNEQCVRSFLRGLYSANGSVVRSRITLKAASHCMVVEVQEMLSSLGIPSYYTTNKPSTIQFPNGEYTNRESYDLNITTGRVAFARLIGFIQKYKTAKLVEACCVQQAHNAKTEFEVVHVEDMGEQQVYDITVDAPEHTYWTGGLLVSNCSEIGMNPTHEGDDGIRRTGWSFCNLCEINAAKLHSRESFLVAACAAALIGTLQASYTDMPYLGPVSEAIARRDALIGVGMTGMQDAPAIACDPGLQRAVAEQVVNLNTRIAAWIGINAAARCTTVKPSGTTSLELGCVGSGIHFHHARRYFRRVTADGLEVVFQAFREANPHMCTEMPDGKWSIEFPVQAPADARVRGDFTAIEFLEIVRSTQNHWVRPGTARDDGGLTHNVSNTVTVRAQEWDEVADYVWRHRGELTGVSYLADTGDNFPFAPFQEVRTDAQLRRWNELVAGYRPVDYLTVLEATDTTAVSQEAACANGACTYQV